MIVLIGGGGHGKVVLDALLAGGTPAGEIIVRDGDGSRIGSSLLGLPVEGPELDAALAGLKAHVAIGSCAARERLYGALAAIGAIPHHIVHPAAVIAASAILEPGMFAAAGAIVGPGARV